MSTSSKSLAPSTQVPDFSPYTKGTTETAARAYSYFVVGSMGLITAAGAKSTVSDFLTNMSASSDVLALAKVEVDLSAIPEGKNVIIKWRGKPVFIRHRTSDEIAEANSVDVKSLRDPQTDAERVKKPEWYVVLACGENRYDADPADPQAHHARCLHPLGMCPYRCVGACSKPCAILHVHLLTLIVPTCRRGWRLRRMVLPLPRISLRHLYVAPPSAPCCSLADTTLTSHSWTCPTRTRTTQPRGSSAFPCLPPAELVC